MIPLDLATRLTRRDSDDTEVLLLDLLSQYFGAVDLLVGRGRFWHCWRVRKNVQCNAIRTKNEKMLRIEWQRFSSRRHHMSISSRKQNWTVSIYMFRNPYLLEVWGEILDFESWSLDQCNEDYSEARNGSNGSWRPLRHNLAILLA